MAQEYPGGSHRAAPSARASGAIRASPAVGPGCPRADASAQRRRVPRPAHRL